MSDHIVAELSPLQLAILKQTIDCTLQTVVSGSSKLEVDTIVPRGEQQAASVVVDKDLSPQCKKIKKP